MKELVLFLEEPSAKAFLDEFLPRIVPPTLAFRTIPHNGKSDLQRSLPVKLKGWLNPDAQFVVLHDKDANDCMELKMELTNICVRARRDIQPIVRIACHELESWFLGDMDSIVRAFPEVNLQSARGKAKFRDVDLLANAAQEMAQLVPSYQKVSGSRAMGRAMENHGGNRSHSFQVFMKSIRSIVARA